MTKRLFDMMASFFGVLVLSPLMVLIAVIIKCDSPGPVFFRQRRVGQHGKIFTILKFRTMVVNQPKNSAQITVGNDARITKTGPFLRKYKLDELPQLINVLRGQMSLVGPRPEVEKYVNTYSQHDRHVIFSVKPGITDLASLQFRNENELLAQSDDPETTYIHKILPRKLALCRYYVKRQTMCLDLAIILKTLKAVL